MSKHQSKVTKAGTELPILDLRGKPYLQVAHRLVWFREEHPNATIKTELLRLENNSAVVKAEIYKDGSLVSSAHKAENIDNFGDFIEKAETGAIGRALAMFGYGTQFDPELDEGDRLADSPIAPATKAKATKTASAKTESKPQAEITVGNKYAATTREDLQKLITATFRVAIKKEVTTKEKVVQELETKYKVKSSNDLNREQAREFLLSLEQLVNS